MRSYEQIFSDFKEGELTSFYQKLYPGLLTYTARLLGDEYAFLAEDCVQDAVFQAYRQQQSFVSPLQWKVFLYTCLRNAAISILRKGQARQNYLTQQENDQEPLSTDLSADFIEQETLSLLYEAIDSLPERYRHLFDLSFEQGLKNAEVAARLQVAEVTIKKQKARLIELLRDRLRGKMDEPGLWLLLALLAGE